MRIDPGRVPARFVARPDVEVARLSFPLADRPAAAFAKQREIYVCGRKIIGRRMTCFDRAYRGRGLRENMAVVDDFQTIAHRLGDARPRERPDTLLPGQAWVWNGMRKLNHDVLQSDPACSSNDNLQGRNGFAEVRHGWFSQPASQQDPYLRHALPGLSHTSGKEDQNFDGDWRAVSILHDAEAAFSTIFTSCRII